MNSGPNIQNSTSNLISSSSFSSTMSSVPQFPLSTDSPSNTNGGISSDSATFSSPFFTSETAPSASSSPGFSTLSPTSSVLSGGTSSTFPASSAGFDSFSGSNSGSISSSSAPIIMATSSSVEPSNPASSIISETPSASNSAASSSISSSSQFPSSSAAFSSETTSSSAAGSSLSSSSSLLSSSSSSSSSSSAPFSTVSASSSVSSSSSSVSESASSLSSSWVSSSSSFTEISSTSDFSSTISQPSSSSSLSLQPSSQSSSSNSEIASSTTSSESSETSSSSSSDSSNVSSFTMSTTHTPSSSGRYSVSTISVLPDTTITTLVTIPTAATASGSGSGSSSVSAKNGRIIGGVVGAVGGALLLGALALLVFLKKRNKSVTNQSPDFADDALASDSEKGTGFSKIFGAKAGPTGAGGVSTYNGLENQVNVRSASVNAGAGAPGAELNDGFEYRGVSNTNNLDSVFRASAGTTGPNSSGQNTATETPRRGHSRYNSSTMGGPVMDTMHESGGYNNQARYSRGSADAPYPTRDEDVNSTFSQSEKSSEYGTDDEFLFHGQPHSFWTHDHHSNNSRSRFTEDLG